MLVLTLLGLARADCPAAVTPTQWTEALDAAEARFKALDTAGYRDALDDVQLAVPCLDGAVTPEGAARFHLLRGLALYTRGDAEGARLSFAAARASEPGVRLDFELVPEGHEVHELVQGAGTPGATRAADPPEDGELWFDGAAAGARPTDRPTLAQWIRDNGTAGSSALLSPGDAMLVYPMRPAPRPDGPDRAQEPSPLRLALGVGGGALLVAGGASYAVALGQAGKVRGPHGPEVELDDLEAWKRRANRFAGIGAALGGLGGAGLIGFAVVR